MIFRAERNVVSALSQPTVHLSTILRSPLLDRAGERLGRVDDLIVRLADDGYPPVTGLKARIGGREVFVPADRIATLEPGAVQLIGEKLNLGRFERREGEVLLREDLLERSSSTSVGPPSLVTRERPRARVHRGLVAGGRRRRTSAPRSCGGGCRVSLRQGRGDQPFLDWSSCRAVRRPRPDGAPALRPPQARQAPSRARSPTSSRRPPTTRARRSSTRSGGPRARGRRLRGARRAPPGGVPERAQRRAGRGDDRADGGRRRRRPDRRARPGARARSCSAAAPAHPAQGRRRCWATTPRPRVG